MPCTQRRSHGNCGGRRFHPWMTPGHPPFHPYMMARFHPFFMTAENEGEDKDFPQMNFSGNDKSTWNESEANYSFQMDVPGVKDNHITIEEKDGEIEVTAIRMSNDTEVSKTYQEIFFVRPSTADLANTVATLDNGVLEIIVPKKSNAPVEVEIENTSPYEPSVEFKEFRTSMDLPGVKLSDIKVQIRQDKAYIEATRQVGDHVIPIRRIIEVQVSSVDATNARAFLQDGVLTLVAPIQENDQEEIKPSGMRTIPVFTTNDAEVPSVFATLSLDEDAGKGEEAAMIVETVTEENEKEEWEKVNEDVNKPASAMK